MRIETVEQTQSDRLGTQKSLRLQSEQSEQSTASSMLIGPKSTAQPSELSELDIIFDATLAAILVVGPDYAIRRANWAARKIFGFETVPLEDVDIGRIVNLQDEKIQSLFAGTGFDSKLGQVVDDIQGTRHDGSTFPMELAIAQAEYEGDAYEIWVCRDILQRKEAELQRDQLERELAHAQKLEALGTLASGIAHEINTPVQYVRDNTEFLKGVFDDLETLIAGYQEALAGPDEDRPSRMTRAKELEAQCDLDYLREEMPHAMQQTLDGLNQISKIVAAIKAFAHPGVDGFSQVDINATIETTSMVAKNSWKYVADMEFDFEEPAPQVECIAGEINQVLLNLIVNAADAIEQKGEDEKGKITIRTKSTYKDILIEIEDTGCGIDEASHERIFDPFFTTKEVGKGTGQGLAIAYNIITNKHNGTIEFTPSPSGGTIFTISLPRDSEHFNADEGAA